MAQVERIPAGASSPGCWATYGEALAREYCGADYRSVHRVTVDIYAIQHLGRTAREIALVRRLAEILREHEPGVVLKSSSRSAASVRQHNCMRSASRSTVAAMF